MTRILMQGFSVIDLSQNFTCARYSVALSASDTPFVRHSGFAATFAAHHHETVRRAHQRAQPVHRLLIQHSYQSAPDTRLRGEVFMARSAVTRLWSVMVQRGKQPAGARISRRHSMPTAPCPTAGRDSSGGNATRMRSSRPRRFWPATARIMAS